MRDFFLDLFRIDIVVVQALGNEYGIRDTKVYGQSDNSRHLLIFSIP